MNKDIESRKKGFSVVLLSWGAYNAGMPTEIAHPSVSEISLPLHPLAHDLLATFTRPEDIAAISDAITFATKYHGAQKRNTGEPQMVHPLRAMIAAREALGDHPLIVKLLQVIALHDTIEDTAVRKRDIHHIFGRNVAWAVDRLSKKTMKIWKPQYAKAEHTYFEDLDAKDYNPEVQWLVRHAKVADRLENMTTLDTLVKPGQGKIRRRIHQITAIERQRAYIQETQNYIIPLLPEGDPLRRKLVEETEKQSARLALVAATVA